MKNIAIIVGSILIGMGIIAASFSSNSSTDTASAVNAVREENGTQIIHITARGGYNPREISAIAGKPTKLEIETKGTYDCSSAFVMPQIGYQKRLPATGITTLDLPTQQKGSSLTGLCAMGMYSFTINFN